MVRQEVVECSKKMLLQLGKKRNREERVLLELGAVEVGMSDRNRNPKPRAQLLLERKRGRNASTSFFFRSLSISKPNRTSKGRKPQRPLFLVNFSIRKCRADKGVG